MIGKQIKKIVKSGRVLFTTPSHDKDSFIIPGCAEILGEKIFKYDLSEITDLDNLADPQGVILQSLVKSAELIGCKDLFYLINGSSSGIVTAMLASLKENDGVLIARNCHKSVINGLVLSGAKPYWFNPKIDKNWQVFKSLDTRDISSSLELHKDISAVIITSPTYEGVDFDIKKIAQICHSKNVILMVDQAHGALKSFFPKYFGENAIKQGADIVIQSLHKTCGAVNPSAILLSNGKISREILQNCLNLTNTSSPSYPLIASVEASVNYLSSEEALNHINNLYSDIQNLKNNLKNYNNIHFYEKNDFSKILVKTDDISGFNLDDVLFDDFNIETELSNNICCTLLCGLGTTRAKLKKLENALKIIASNSYRLKNKKTACPLITPEVCLSPREAFFAPKIETDIDNALNKISGETICEYPPGIPLLIQGEKITLQHIKYLKKSHPLLKVVG